MVRYLVSKKGVPVLASARVDGAAQSRCVLVAKYCEEPFQISFYLQYTTFFHGFDDEQTFTLIYDADNLMHGATSLKTATTPIPHDQLASIARAGNPQMRSLTLTLAKPCKIQCPPSSGILESKTGFEAPFHWLAKLAKATEIEILLDYNWIHADNREPLERFFKQPSVFVGFPKSNDGYRYADWAVFRTIKEESGPPPSYANVVDTNAPQKRSRRSTTRSLSSSPPSKRPQYDVGSPTEIATLSPSPPHTTPGSPCEKPTAPRSHLHTSLEASAALAFQEAINRAVEAQLPAVVGNMLPGILKSVLPDILHSSLAPGRLPSLSPGPAANSSPQSSPSLGILITDRLTELAKDHLATIFDEASDQAYSLRNQADGEFEDIIADHRTDVEIIKEDCIRELGEVVGDKLCKFKEQTDDLVETAVDEVENKTSEVCEGMYDGLESFLEVASASLKKVREGRSARGQNPLRS